MLDALSVFETVAPFLAVVGWVLSFIQLFLPSDTEIILEALEKISKQIAALQQDMDYFFGKVLQAIK